MFALKSRFGIIVAFTLIIACGKPQLNEPTDHFGRQQFAALESKTSLYSYGLICGFLKRYADSSPMNSMGWWQYGPFTLSDELGRITISLKSLTWLDSTHIEIESVDNESKNMESLKLHYDQTRDTLRASKNVNHKNIACSLSETDRVVSRVVACINLIYRSDNSSIRGQFGTLAK